MLAFLASIGAVRLNTLQYSTLYLRKEELQSNPLHGSSYTFGFAASAFRKRTN